MYGNPYVNQNQAMMMQGQMAAMQMGSMNMLNNMTGGMGSTMFFFSGNSIGLESRLEGVRTQTTPLTDASITVTGNQIKQANISCFIFTLVCGSFILIPLFFMCCGWWKRMVNPAYNVPLSTYQRLQSLIYLPSMRSITLVVMDSAFDQTKAKVLYDMLSRSAVKGFTFTNIASNNNYENNEWSDFKQNMKPIKNLPILSDMKWYDQVVL